MDDDFERDRTGRISPLLQVAMDDVEVDHVKKSRPGPCSPGIKVQKLSEILISSMLSDSNSEQLETIVTQLMSTLHNEVGFSEEEHASLRNLAGDIEEAMEGEINKRRMRKRQRRLSQLEPGLHYNLMDHQPVTITENIPTSGCARLTFRAHFMGRHSYSSSDVFKRQNSLMKVW